MNIKRSLTRILQSKVFTVIFERSCGILTLYFPFIEAAQYFAPKVFLYGTSTQMKYFFAFHVSHWIRWYANNSYFMFGITLLIFYICSTGRPLVFSKFLRFNVIQSILLYVLISAIGQILCMYTPLIFRRN